MAPVVDAAVPSAHGEQADAPPALKEPTPQSAQEAASAGAKEPPLQLTQLDAAVAPAAAVVLPPPHDTHALGVATRAYVPLGHVVWVYRHVVAPTGELRPVAQAVQAALPGEDANVPAAHCVHAPPAVLVVPTGQGLHAASPSFEVWPAGHATHALLAFDPAGLIVFAPQAVQAAVPDAYVPDGHVDAVKAQEEAAGGE